MSLHEKISSLYDDELEVSERIQVLSSLNQNEEHKQIWGRYCIIGDAMRSNLPDNPKHDLFSRVQIALESEPVLLAPSVNETERQLPINKNNVVELAPKPAKEHFFKPVAGFAVAASVALASVLGFQMFTQPIDELSQPAVATSIIATPITQELNISPIKTDVANVALSSTDTVESVNGFDDVIYAQQSLIDDGQWTRITRIGNILLDDKVISHQPHVLDPRQVVDFNTGVFPYARALNLDDVKVE